MTSPGSDHVHDVHVHPPEVEVRLELLELLHVDWLEAIVTSTTSEMP